MCKNKKFFKYFLKKDGREVKMGDDIKLTQKEETPLGDAIISISMTVDEDNIEKLVKHGFVVKKRIQDCDKKIPDDMYYYIRRLADKLEWHYDTTVYVINCMRHVLPAITFQILLKEIALWMEQNLDDKPLAKNKAIFVFDIQNGKIYRQYTQGIENFSTFAGFSSQEHAEKAKEILEKLYNEIYG